MWSPKSISVKYFQRIHQKKLKKKTQDYAESDFFFLFSSMKIKVTNEY